MGRTALPVCGFGHVILYNDISDFQTYTVKMKDYTKMTVGVTDSYYKWVKNTTKKFLNNA